MVEKKVLLDGWGDKLVLFNSQEENELFVLSLMVTRLLRLARSRSLKSERLNISFVKSNA